MTTLIYRAICWIFFTIFSWFLSIVAFVEKFFNIFAGTEAILYNDRPSLLINLFFAHDTVTNVFWAMALIAMVLSFGFCIVSLARKVTDVSGTNKHTVGQIMSNFVRSLLVILFLNAGVVAAINITNVLLERVNFALSNAEYLGIEKLEKEFSDWEYGTMARILSRIANYNVNSTENSRYNINSCFNAVRGDLLTLYGNGFFEYDYPMTESGHHTWQSALGMLAKSADLTQDLQIGQYYPEVANAIETIRDELANNPSFKPVERAKFSINENQVTSDVMIFLVSSMGAELNTQYKNGSFSDALRQEYLSGNKDYTDFDVISEDFDYTEINYLVGIVAAYLFIRFLLTAIFQFIVRLYNLILLYIVSPLFVSSMSLDEGGKFQSWLQAFVIQLFAGFGSVIVMRLYLIIIPIVTNSKVVFFPADASPTLEYTARLLLIVGGGWAVTMANGVLTGILAGQPGMAALQQEGRVGAMVSRAMRSAPGKATGLVKGVMDAPRQMAQAPTKIKDYFSSFRQPARDRERRQADWKQFKENQKKQKENSGGGNSGGGNSDSGVPASSNRNRNGQADKKAKTTDSFEPKNRPRL